MCVTYSNLHDGKEPTHIFLMAQSLDASVSSLMSFGLVAKSFSVAEVCFSPSACVYLILLAGTAS